MKNDKCLKKEFYKFLNNIKRISEFLDYKTINQFLITSREISQVAQDLRLNYTLDLRHSTFNNSEIKLILHKSRVKYEKLVLEFKDIFDEDIDSFSNNLIEINLNGCHNLSDDGILKLKLKCNNLKHLFPELYWMPQLSDKSISILLKSCPNLIYLNLSGCKNITDLSISNLNVDCPKIEKIDLTRCSGLTVNSLSNICRLKHLSYLNLYALANLNCEFMNILSLNILCRLEFLDICGNLHINDSHLKICTKVMKNLKYLNLTWCINISDQGLEQLIPELYQLELLSIHGILGVTDSTINLMKKNKKLVGSLKTLDVYGCMNIKNKDKDYLKTHFVFLKVFKHHT